MKTNHKIYNVPIINYFTSKVYCKGYFTPPTQDDINRIVGKKVPYSMFVPVEEHGWGIYLWTKEDEEDLIKSAK